MKTNLWILTEERPKECVIKMIFNKFANDQKCAYFSDSLRIFPILNETSQFTFTYEIIGFKCAKVDNVFLKTISGSSSFIDFLVFYQADEPKIEDQPMYAIEETKTDDSESRNTGVYQRCSKFVYIQNYYPKVKMIMLYNLQVEQNVKPTDTNIFGVRLLLTYGVEILGKELDRDIFKPFSSINEMIALKKSMRSAPKGNIPIIITKTTNKIQISGRLFKSNSLSHDPNIGALTIMSAVIRQLGWSDKIEITQHGLMQKHVGKNNKFIQIANILDISLAGLIIPESILEPNYWHYETDGEKLGTIFIHLVVDNFTTGYSIFENHAGCEKGYFITSENKLIPLPKYKDQLKYKAGDKSQIIFIPDLILIDFDRSEVIDIEGKKYQFRADGISELNNYDFIEKEFVARYYPNFKIIRTVVLYGGVENEIVEVEVGFLLNENGKLILGVQAPEIFREAINNLLDFWAD